jgi:uncharacterized hydrophobic protein (TIGR00271 family)
MLEKKQSLFKPFYIAGKRQQKVYAQITEQAQGDFDFYILSFFSGVIITLGILVDSTAVVIGGMLIAPLVWPILAMALGITMGRSFLLRKSLSTLIKSALVIFVVAVLIGIVVPDLVVESSEYLSRTSPTLLELLIGLAAGFVGAFIIAYPKMGSAIAGVVVAAAVVPPLATIGLSLARSDFSSVGGAVLLFLSNLVAIVFAASILFIISNFKSKTAAAEEKRKTGFRWTLLLLIVILVPLFYITTQTTQHVRQVKAVQEVVGSTVGVVELSDIKIQEGDNAIDVSLILRSKNTIETEQIEAIKNVLAERFNKAVVLKVNIIPIVVPGEELPEYLSTQVQIETLPAPEFVQPEFVKCPVQVNDLKTIRKYPVSLGCPVCPEIIACGDGREFPAQTYLEETGLCSSNTFENGAPCFFEKEAVSDINIEIIN